VSRIISVFLWILLSFSVCHDRLCFLRLSVSFLRFIVCLSPASESSRLNVCQSFYRKLHLCSCSLSLFLLLFVFQIFLAPHQIHTILKYHGNQCTLYHAHDACALFTPKIVRLAHRWKSIFCTLCSSTPVNSTSFSVQRGCGNHQSTTINSTAKQTHTLQHRGTYPKTPACANCIWIA